MLNSKYSDIVLNRQEPPIKPDTVKFWVISRSYLNFISSKSLDKPFILISCANTTSFVLFLNVSN